MSSTMANGTSALGVREVQNHVLFEVATEVANKGQSLSCMLAECSQVAHSRRHLLSTQVQGARDDRRVWPPLYLHRAI